MARTTTDPKTIYLGVRINEDDQRTLARLAQVGGCSPSEALRRLLRGEPGALDERVKTRTSTGALNARSGDIFYIEYNDPKVIVELPSKDRVFYDPRDEQPADPAMVASLKLRGQEVPAEGYKEPGFRDGKQAVILTKGRRRWKAMQAAWAEMLAEGGSVDFLPPFRLIVKKYINDTDAFEASVIENVHSLDDIAKGRKLQSYLDLVGDNERMRERARVIFNLKDMPAMKALLKLLKVAP